MQQSITLLGQIVLTQPGDVFLVIVLLKNKMISTLSANQMGWHIAVECCGTHAG
jgi:hypothetical protein